MRVLFYDFDAGALGVQYLLAMLKPLGHEVYLYLDCSCPRQYLASSGALQKLLALTDDQVCDDLLTYDAKVFCFSITSLTYAPILSIIHRLKARNPNAIVVCGGVHATLLTEPVVRQRDIDFTVTGEAEISFPALLDALDEMEVEQVKALPAERLPGVWNLRDGQVVDRGLSPVPEDLNALPFLEKELHLAINPSLIPVYATVCVRGCIYTCSFCNDPAIREIYDMHKRAYCRSRSVDSVLAELRLAKERYHPKHIEFHDDIFAADREWLNEFSRRYPQEIGLPYNMQTHPLLLDDTKLELLARSGCTTIELGVQSACPEVRSGVLRRYESNERVEQVLRKTLELGMRAEIDFIANLPGETPEHIERMLDFVYATRPSLVNLPFLVCLPKTELTEMALKSGYITEAEVQAIQEHGAMTDPWYPAPDLRTRYRVLPIQLVVACLFAPALARKINHALGHTFLGVLSAPFSPLLVVGARLLPALFDRRAYHYRGQLLLGMGNMRRVLLRKLFGVRPARPRLSAPLAQEGDAPRP